VRIIKNLMRSEFKFAAIFAVAIALAAGNSFAQTAAEMKSEHTVSFEPVLGLTYVKGRVNGSRPLHMVLDTGASDTVLKPEIAAELGLKHSGETVQAAGQGKGADETMRLVKGVTLEFAGQKLTDQTIATLSVDYIDREAGQPTDGLLGGNIFVNFVVHEDYAGHTVTLIRPEKFVAPKGFTAVPLTVAGTASLLQLHLVGLGGEKIDGLFLLDSGQVGSVFFMSSFVDAHPGLKSGRLIALPPVTAVGGDMQVSVGRLASIGVGPFVVAGPPALYPSNSPGGLASTPIAGIVGAQVLGRFDVIFDYPHGMLWLKPNAEFGKPFFTNASGLQLEVEPPEFHRVKVRAVIAGSPAEQAGVMAGDIVVAMSNTPLEDAATAGSPQLTLAEISEWLRETERDVYLRIERAGRLLVLHFKTKQLV